MGQASKILPTWSISGRLRLKRIKLYKEKAPVRNGACNEREKKKRKREKNTLYWNNLIKYKNTSFLDTTEESFP